MTGKDLNTIYSEIEKKLLNDQNLLNSISSYLSLTVQRIFSDSIKKDISYCMIFMMNSDKIARDIAKMLSVDLNELSYSFMVSWKLPSHDFKMYGNPFYHVMLILYAFGVKNGKDDIGRNAIKLILMKLWNGRLRRSIRYCKPEYMNYVINNMITNRRLFRKYSNPFSLLTEYFLPSIYDSDNYKKLVKADVSNTKIVFTRCYNRITQLFYQDYYDDPITGKSGPKSGIANLYYKAYEEGKKITTSTQEGGPEGVESSLDRLTGDEIEQVLSRMIDYMITYQDKNYSDELIDMISKSCMMKPDGIRKIIDSLHRHENEELIKDIAIKIINMIYPISKSKVCTSYFFVNTIKMKIISSKNTPSISALNESIFMLLRNVYKHMGYNFDDYSASRKLHLRNMMIYLISYFLQKSICSMSE
ncbi:MAG: hypothetical protein QXD03_03705 [Candidatus Anstonellales archaeon]